MYPTVHSRMFGVWWLSPSVRCSSPLKKGNSPVKSWIIGCHLADIQGKEAGTHKCDNLRALIAQYEATHGRRPVLWFVEDRLETLQHVTTHTDCDDVGLFSGDLGL